MKSKVEIVISEQWSWKVAWFLKEHYCPARNHTTLHDHVLLKTISTVPGKLWSEISVKCSQNCNKKTYHISRVILLRSEVKISGGQIVRGQYSGNLSSGSIWAQLILTWLARKLISLEKFTPSSKNTAEKNTDWNFK